MEGNNFVELVGVLSNPSLKETRNGNLRFQGKVAIPHVFNNFKTGEQEQGFKYIKIAAWGDTASEIGSLPEGVPVKVHGLVNERSYNGNCKNCGSPEKKYWTDVLVDSFMVVEEEVNHA